MMRTQGGLFAPLDLRARIFHKVPRANLRDRLLLMAQPKDAVDRRGRPIQCRVTCTPFMGVEQEIRGVVLVMEERREAGAAGPAPVGP